MLVISGAANVVRGLAGESPLRLVVAVALLALAWALVEGHLWAYATALSVCAVDAVLVLAAAEPMVLGSMLSPWIAAAALVTASARNAVAGRGAG